jgi:peroxiredoxin
MRVLVAYAAEPLQCTSNLETAKMPLKAGDVAPQFSLPAVIGENRIEFRLSDYLGKQCVVVTFHPLDWTPT